MGVEYTRIVLIYLLLSFPRRSLLPRVETEEWEVDDWIQMR